MFDGSDGYAAVCRAAGAAVRPRIPLWPSEWAERHRVLSSKSSAEATNWRNDRVPYLRAIMDALDVRHPAWMVVFAKASQVGASECGLNWVGHTIDEDPVPFMALFPGEKLGRRWMRKRAEPMIASTPSLRAKIPAGRRSDVGNTLLEKDFPDGGLAVRSANIATDMASDAFGKILADEVDRFPFELGEEGDPIELMLRRLATYVGRKKVFLNSSPTIESLSHIWRWWLDSSMGHYFVPCPHCGTKQVLEWANLTYTPGRIVKDARYRCIDCAALIDEHHKTDMLAGGEWRHEHPERCEDVIGFHVNCLYTPLGLGDTWNDNAQAFERAKRSPAKLKAFENTRLGVTHKDPTEKLDWEILYEQRREPFAMREIARGVLILTAGVDVQKDRLEVQVLGWSKPSRVRVVDYRVIEGDPTRPEVWDELDQYLAREYVSAGGVKMRLTVTLVDSGYLQEYVLTFTRARRARRIFASKGSQSYQAPAIGMPSTVDVKGKAKARRDRSSAAAQQYPLGVHSIKEALYKQLQADGGTADAPVLPEERHFRFPDELGEEYFRQLCAEVFDPNKHRWVKLYERNEVLDTMVLAIAAAMHHAVAIDRMSDEDWSALEALYEPRNRAQTAGMAIPVKPAPPPRDKRGGGFGSDDWNIQ